MAETGEEVRRLAEYLTHFYILSVSLFGTSVEKINVQI